jgi:signal transduction histidine kinase
MKDNPKKEIERIKEKNKSYMKSLEKNYEAISSSSEIIRDNLNSIMGFTQLLIEEEFGQISLKQKEILKEIFQSSEKINESVDSLDSNIEVSWDLKNESIPTNLRI